MTHAPAVDSLEQVIADLTQPRTLSQFMGSNDMALALVQERESVAARLAALTRPPSGSERLRSALIRLIQAADYFVRHPSEEYAQQRCGQMADLARAALASPQGAGQRQDIDDLGGAWRPHFRAGWESPPATQGDAVALPAPTQLANTYASNGRTAYGYTADQMRDYAKQVAALSSQADTWFGPDSSGGWYVKHGDLFFYARPQEMVSTDGFIIPKTAGVQAAQVSDEVIDRLAIVVYAHRFGFSEAVAQERWPNVDQKGRFLEPVRKALAQPGSAAHGGEVSDG